MRNFLKRIFKPKFQGFIIDNKVRVELAFEVGGKRYYQFANQMEAPAKRQLASLGMYDEIEMRCDRKYLEDHCKAVEVLLSGKTINILQLAKLNVHLKERMNLLPLPDLIYRLASVVYFDMDEPLYDYDYEYNAKKIEFWKANGGTLDFFSKTQLKDLMPALGMPLENLQAFSNLVKKVAEIHQEHITSILSPKV